LWKQLTLDVSKVSCKDRLRVRLSIAVVLIFAGTVFPVLIATYGVWGLVKFWLIPWLVFHFWFSTFTLTQHTSPDILWKADDHWNAAQAQLCGTVHCNYPQWIEFLCHDINYHIPHHISTAIPSYNLRLAHQSLRQNWGPYLKECNFSWSLIKQIISQCYLYSSAKQEWESRVKKSSDRGNRSM
jgi:omega-6 fatty acid desaturase (delta-12 desaturase)